MKTFLVRSIVSGCLLGASLCQAADDPETLTPAPSDRAPPATPVPDHYIVQVVAGVDPSSVAAAHAVAPGFVYRAAVRGFAAIIPPGRVAAVRADSRVLNVIPDRKVAAIGKPSGGSTTAEQVIPEGVRRIGAAPDAILPTTGAGVGVAIVDTGVDLAHADLLGVRDGYSAFGGSAHDNNGHGTHVAGTVGAKNNTIGVVGVAPDSTIYAVKVLDASGSGSDSSVIAGLDWVAAQTLPDGSSAVSPAIRVVNMSLGREGTVSDNPALHDAVKTLVSKGIAVVVAAGNDARLDISQQVPSAYPEAMAVASTTAADGTSQYRFFSGSIPADTASYFTSDGAGVAVSAPGEDKENVAKNGFLQSVGILSLKAGGGTTRMSGTSMAAPHVAGVAALIYSAYPSADAAEVRDRVTLGAARIGTAPLNSPTSSYSFDGTREGVLDAAGALAGTP